MRDTCLFCVLDAHEGSDAERRAAYYVAGLARDAAPPPCDVHRRAVVLGTAFLIEAIGSATDASRKIREIVREDLAERRH